MIQQFVQADAAAPRDLTEALAFTRSKLVTGDFDGIA